MSTPPHAGLKPSSARYFPFLAPFYFYIWYWSVLCCAIAPFTPESDRYRSNGSRPHCCAHRLPPGPSGPDYLLCNNAVILSPRTASFRYGGHDVMVRRLFQFSAHFDSVWRNLRGLPFFAPVPSPSPTAFFTARHPLHLITFFTFQNLVNECRRDAINGMYSSRMPIQSTFNI